MSSRVAVCQRRQTILHHLAAEALTVERLLRKLRPRVQERTLRDDLRILWRDFPGRLRSEYRGKTKCWWFEGTVPRLLSRPLVACEDDQLAALVAARGLLRIPENDEDLPAEHARTVYNGPLAQALDRLLRDTGLDDDATAIAPEAVTISRFGAAPVADQVFLAAFDAIRTGDALRYTYTNLTGDTHPVHAKPVRLAHIAGEWHLLAWAADARHPPGLLKQYRLSRMTRAVRSGTAPPDCPLTGLRSAAASHLQSAFRATGSMQRHQVVIACSPRAWPFIDGRRWGAKQHADPLPDGWHRLTFSTTGLAEARHWILSFGAEVRAEQPTELVTWIRDQAQRILAATPAARTLAGKVAREGSRVPR